MKKINKIVKMLLLSQSKMHICAKIQIGDYMFVNNRIELLKKSVKSDRFF